MASVELYADRVLRHHTTRSGERRGLSRYFSIKNGLRPSWWRDSMSDPESGEIIGVFENLGWPDRPAVVVTTTSLIVIRQDGRTKIPYRSIRSFEPLSKAPVAEELVLELDSGTRETVPIVGEEEGAIFTFMRFLVDARRAVRSG